MKKRVLLTIVALTTMLAIVIFVKAEDMPKEISEAETAKIEDENKEYPIATDLGNLPTYSDLVELEKEADVILKVQPTGKSEVKDFYQSLNYIDSTTISEVKVIQSYKGELQKKDIISVYEPAFIKDDIFVSLEGYLPMNDRDPYVLFLQDNENGTYVGIGGYQGKFNMALKDAQQPYNKFTMNDNTLYESDYIGANLEQFNKLKKEVLKKYK